MGKKKKKKKTTKILPSFSKEVLDLRQKYEICPKCKNDLAWTYPATAICPNCGWIMHHQLSINVSTGEVDLSETHDPFIKEKSIFKPGAGFELLIRTIPKIADLYNMGKEEFAGFELIYKTEANLPIKEKVKGSEPGFMTLQVSDVLYVMGDPEGVLLDFGVGHIHLTKGESKKLRQLLTKAEEEVLL